MSRVALTAGLFVLLTAVGVEAQDKPARAGTQSTADDQDARDLFKLGKQAFDEGRYERALKYFKDAYELSHRAALLSNIGTVLDRLRRDAEALEAYKSYLEQVPDAANRAFVEERVRLIEEAMRKDEAPPPAATTVPTPAETAQAEVARTPLPGPVQAPPQAIQARSESSSITSRWWFWAGLGTAAAAAVVVAVAASSGGGTIVQGPVLQDQATRVREL